MGLSKGARKVLKVLARRGGNPVVVFELREGGAFLRPRRRVPLEALLGRLKGKRGFPGEEAERRAREEAWREGA